MRLFIVNNTECQSWEHTYKTQYCVHIGSLSHCYRKCLLTRYVLVLNCLLVSIVFVVISHLESFVTQSKAVLLCIWNYHYFSFYQANNGNDSMLILILKISFVLGFSKNVLPPGYQHDCISCHSYWNNLSKKENFFQQKHSLHVRTNTCHMRSIFWASHKWWKKKYKLPILTEWLNYFRWKRFTVKLAITWDIYSTTMPKQIFLFP